MSCQKEPVRWAELHKQEQQKIGNGCGPEFLPDWAIKLLFGWMKTASCRRHDFAYERGGSKTDRKNADKGFYKAMVEDAKQYAEFKTIYKFVAARIIAGLFYALVRVFGGFFFLYGPYRPLADIVASIDL